MSDILAKAKAKVETENDCGNYEKIFENKINLEALEKICMGKTDTKKRQKKRPGNEYTIPGNR